MREKRNLEGLGGWLILVGLTIVVSPLSIIAFIISTYSEIFSNGLWESNSLWEIVTTPGTDAYNPLLGVIIIGEISISAAFAVVWLYIAFLFFTKRKAFPKWYVGILLLKLTFVFIDALSIKLAIPNTPLFNNEIIKELGRSLVAVLIWVPYMLASKRVKTTFVNVSKKLVAPTGNANDVKKKYIYETKFGESSKSEGGMKRYVENDEINQHINIIADLVFQGSTNKDIVKVLKHRGIINLNGNNGDWDESLVETIISDFKLRGIKLLRDSNEPLVALGPCRACSHQVSEEAISCPNCGTPNPYRGTNFQKQQIYNPVTENNSSEIGILNRIFIGTITGAFWAAIGAVGVVILLIETSSGFDQFAYAIFGESYLITAMRGAIIGAIYGFFSSIFNW